MAENLRFHSLFRGATVSISDVGCRPRTADRGGEEAPDDHVVVFPRSGLFVKHTGHERVVADANHVLFLNRHHPYRVSHPVPGGDDCTVLTVSAESLADAAERYDASVRDRPTRPFAFSLGPNGPREAVLLQSLRRCLLDGTPDPFAVEEVTLFLLGSTVQAAYDIRGTRSIRASVDTLRAHDEIVHWTKTVLGGRFASRLTIDEVAQAVACSPYHLCRVFRRIAGMPIHRYLTSLRLRASLERLADGVNLTGLALDLGFSSHAHFTDSFRRSFGIPPSAFRARTTLHSLREMSKNLEV